MNESANVRDVSYGKRRREREKRRGRSSEKEGSRYVPSQGARLRTSEGDVAARRTRLDVERE